VIAAEQRIPIVSGGLAGLACALRLHVAGARPFIFERSDGVDGRVRTDAMDGFLLDRGFQVFLSGIGICHGGCGESSLKRGFSRGGQPALARTRR
jgi:2-polyprenyl-6-methoxyphenol hydroxylase-like FAD-dependent oxidoreductase